MNKKWWKAVGIHALRTIAHTAVASMGTALMMSDVHWSVVLSASAMAGLLSVLTSVAALPDPKE